MGGRGKGGGIHGAISTSDFSSAFLFAFGESRGGRVKKKLRATHHKPAWPWPGPAGWKFRPLGFFVFLNPAEAQPLVSTAPAGRAVGVATDRQGGGVAVAWRARGLRDL